MDDQIIYVIIAILYFVVTALGGRKKKKEAQKRRQAAPTEKQEAPSQEEADEFERMFEEFFGDKSKPKEAAAPAKKPETSATDFREVIDSQSIEYKKQQEIMRRAEQARKRNELLRQRELKNQANDVIRLSGLSRSGKNRKRQKEGPTYLFGNTTLKEALIAEAILKRPYAD